MINLDNYHSNCYSIEKLNYKKWQRCRPFNEITNCGGCGVYFNTLTKPCMFIVRKIIENGYAKPLKNICCSKRCAEFYLFTLI